MLFIQWKENVNPRIPHVLKEGYHTHESQVCEWAFSLWGLYHLVNEEGFAVSKKKHIISEELGYYSNDSVAIV